MQSKKIFLFLLIFILITGWLFSGWPPIWQNPRVPPQTKQAKAVATNMLLFWDGSTAPSGWSIVTSYDTKFPRGESAANFGVTGGSSTHTPTSGTVVNNASSVGKAAAGSTAVSAYTHTHTSLSVTVGSGSNEPAYRSLKLIQYTGIPVSIPAGAIAIFDASAPSGWTRQTAQDNTMMKVNSTVAIGGSDNHTHTLTWSSLSAATATGLGNTNLLAATTVHTHTAPAATATNASDTTRPPYIEVVIAKADSATASLPNGMIAMFDADPGFVWTIASNSGGAFYQQFIRGAATYNGTSQGAATHTHTAATSGASGAASARAKGSNTAGTNTSGPTHTHTLTATFNSVDNTPPYFNVVYAKKNTNVAPNAPTQDSPTDAAMSVSVTPTFTMTATDSDPDNISYKVAIYSNSACTTVVQTNDQAVSSTGWTGTNATCTASPTACYTSGTQGSFLTQTALTANTQYWWKASAKDPDGNGNFTDSSTCNTFTTGAAQSLTFSLGSNILALGTLSSAAITSGSHTLTVATNASGGMVVTVSGTTLTSGVHTISACATGCTSSIGTEQFGINLKDNTTPNVGLEASGTPTIGVAATGYATIDTFRFVTGETIASSAGVINDTTFTVSYIANIAAPTEAGSYNAILTYIATATF
ncbi:MAG: hypothetical protein Q8R30_02410 [bacterium]|nr:hypothetical protein [bacterium]